MKFDDKFRKAAPDDLREHLAGVILVGLVAPCLVCGNRTGWVHLSSESRVCSEECLSKLDFELEAVSKGAEP